MNKIVFLLLAAILFKCGTAQGVHYTDSLRSLLKKAPKDTNYIASLLNLADAIVYDSPEASMNCAQEALYLSGKLTSPKNKALSYNQIGIAYYVKGKNLEALDNFQKAMKEGETLHNSKLNGRIFNNIANLYGDLKQYDQALDYYRRLIAISKDGKLRNDEAVALFNMGTVYTEEKDYATALEQFEKSLTIAQQDSNMKLLPFILSNIGIVYNQQQEYSSAFACFRKAIDYANSTHSETPKAQALEGLSKVYLARKNYSQAENFALKSLVIARNINSPEWLSDAWQVLSEVYEKQHRNEKALVAYKNYVRFKDSLFNDDKRAELTRKEIQFDFERKEALIKSKNDQQLTLAKAKAERERIMTNAVGAAGAILLLAGLSSFVFYKRKRDAEQQKNEADFQAQVSDTEMKALRLQMNPHFIFNSLNSISDYIRRNNIETADYYLTRFAKVMRLTLEYSDQKTISLAEDLHALELYLELEAARFNNKFTYEIKVDPDIDADNTLIPPMLLQPFVENSIWHGLAEKKGEGRICIEINKQSEMINCIVEDNGVGRKHFESSQRLKKSLGMQITRSRIEILNKLKKTKAAIELFDLHEGFRVQGSGKASP